MGSTSWISRARRTMFKAASIGALSAFGTVYFVALSFGSIAWAGLALSPWLLDAAKLSDRWGAAGPWLPRAGSLFALACFLAMGRSIREMAAPITARGRPGGSWAAAALMSWLAWVDCSLRMGREPPACLSGSGLVACDAASLARQCAGMARAALELPRRTMAIFWGLALMVAMPLGAHLAMAAWIPLAIMQAMFPGGASIGLLARVRLAASDFAREGSQEWAEAERLEIDKAVESALAAKLAKADKARAARARGDARAEEGAPPSAAASPAKARGRGKRL